MFDHARKTPRDGRRGKRFHWKIKGLRVADPTIVRSSIHDPRITDEGSTINWWEEA